jgi:hypothetical protein
MTKNMASAYLVPSSVMKKKVFIAWTPVHLGMISSRFRLDKNLQNIVGLSWTILPGMETFRMELFSIELFLIEHRTLYLAC